MNFSCNGEDLTFLKVDEFIRTLGEREFNLLESFAISDCLRSAWEAEFNCGPISTAFVRFRGLRVRVNYSSSSNLIIFCDLYGNPTATMLDFHFDRFQKLRVYPYRRIKL